jgi:hypothetical protein
MKLKINEKKDIKIIANYLKYIKFWGNCQKGRQYRIL